MYYFFHYQSKNFNKVQWASGTISKNSYLKNNFLPIYNIGERIFNDVEFDYIHNNYF